MTEPNADVQGRIFISYRRDDSAYPAGWPYDRLAERFGEEQIFKDIDSIDLGDDFADEIGAAVGSADVLLALIGDSWLAAADEHGSRRLDDAEDFVRIEIEAALTRNVRVIPILVEGASMPSEDQLPPSLAPLARRQALELSPTRFSADTDRLLRTLESAPAAARAAEESAPTAGAPTGQEPPKAAETLPDDPVTLRGRRTRPLVVTLALAGAGLGLVSNVSRGENDAHAYFTPETLGVPLLVAALAILLQAGRIRELLADGALLGFGLLTPAFALQPIIAVAVACSAVYALGKEGAVRLLAAGLTPALAAQTALYGRLLVVVLADYRGSWQSAAPTGFLVGFGAAALFAAAGLSGRRSDKRRVAPSRGTS